IAELKPVAEPEPAAPPAQQAAEPPPEPPAEETSDEWWLRQSDETVMTSGNGAAANGWDSLKLWWESLPKAVQDKWRPTLQKTWKRTAIAVEESKDEVIQ